MLEGCTGWRFVAEECAAVGPKVHVADPVGWDHKATPLWPDPDDRQSEDFLNAYMDASGRSWTAHEVRAAWAAGLWTRAFDAKKATPDRRRPLPWPHSFRGR